MAYDLWTGRQNGRDWSMGGWSLAEAAASSATKKIPWVPIGIGMAAAGALLLLPSGKPAHAAAGSTGSHRVRRVTSPTLKIPAMTDAEMHKLDPLGVYKHRRG